MHILLAEDDHEKAERIVEYVQETFFGSRVSVVRSLHSTLMELVEGKGENYDLLLLDMTMPTFDSTFSEAGGEIENFAGRQLLEQMDLRGITVQVIVVTMFDGIADVSLDVLSKDLATDFPKIYRGLVKYSQAQKGWKESLKGLIMGVVG